MIRIVGLSATLPNYRDVGCFLGVGDSGERESQLGGGDKREAGAGRFASLRSRAEACSYPALLSSLLQASSILTPRTAPSRWRCSLWG